MTTTHVLRAEIKAGRKMRLVLSQPAGNGLVFELPSRQVLQELDRMERGQVGPFLVAAWPSTHGECWLLTQEVP
jgi:hypothetical protein